MIPCPHCDREFEKRAGLMRHITSLHGPLVDPAPVPVNPGGAIEPVVPVENVRHYTGASLPVSEEYVRDHPEQFVEPETYAESLDETAPGQEPYVDPPVEAAKPLLVQSPDHAGLFVDEHDRYFRYVDGEFHPVDPPAVPAAYRMVAVPTPVHLTMDIQPDRDQQVRIRTLIRAGYQKRDAWMAVVGYEPPPDPPQPVDERPLRLQQVAFRVRSGYSDEMDARWLLRLAEIGADAVAALSETTFIGGTSDGELTHPDIVNLWKEVIL